MSRLHFTYAQKVCIRRAGLAMQRSGALWPGCRIGIAVSGGLDSFVLLKTMRIRQAILPFPVEIMALHINPGYAVQSHLALGPWLAANGIAGHIEVDDFGPKAHCGENGGKSPCFLCAWQRRKRFFELCRQYRLTHLALGHNADDLAATFLLNLLRNAKVAGMSMHEEFFKGALHVIRPLLLVEKKYIRQAARQWDLPVWENACPSAGHTARSGMEQVIANICIDLPNGRKCLVNGLTRWQMEQDNAKKQFRPGQEPADL